MDPLGRAAPQRLEYTSLPPPSSISNLKKHWWKLISRKKQPFGIFWSNTYGNLPNSNYVSYLHVTVLKHKMLLSFCSSISIVCVDDQLGLASGLTSLQCKHMSCVYDCQVNIYKEYIKNNTCNGRLASWQLHPHPHLPRPGLPRSWYERTSVKIQFLSPVLAVYKWCRSTSLLDPKLPTYSL